MSVPLELAQRRLGSPRWWLIASIAFAVLVIACAPMAMAAFVLLSAANLESGASPWLLLFVPVILVGIPFVGALGIASGLESLLRRTGHPDHAPARGWRIAAPIMFVLSPAVILPLWLLSTTRSMEREEARDLALYVAGDTRPIVASDTAGFCAPPVWRMRDSLPEVTLAVRPRTPGPHRISLDALDHANHRFGIDERRELSAGVNRMTLTFVRVGDTKAPIWWPIRVYDVTLIDEGPERPVMLDSRRSDSLFVFDAEGLRPPRVAAPTPTPDRP